ncbi:MAG TPA: family 10 glycosylhydrolase, partial [Geobacteraceae bacterium]
INEFVERLHTSIKTAKPWVKFGISPFGIWRPGNPPQVQGFDSYAKLYADSRKWLANGWVDYFSPQLYWAIDAPEQRFPVLLKWWTDQNPRNRLLVPGLASNKAAGPWTTSEILEQIRIGRQQDGVNGQIHWNMSALLKNSALAGALQRGPYAEPALVPGCTWVRRSVPEKPLVSATQDGKSTSITFKPGDSEPVGVWLLQTRSGGAWQNNVLPRERRTFTFDSAPPDAIAVSAVDRYGNVSRPATLARQSTPN